MSIVGSSDWLYYSHQDTGDVREKEDDPDKYEFRPHLKLGIYRKISALDFNLMDSHKGKVATAVVFMVGSRLQQYVLNEKHQFVCVEDSGEALEEPLAYVKRIQQWEWWGTWEDVKFKDERLREPLQ